MALNNTGNPVPSDKGLDLQDNAKVLDELVNDSLSSTATRTGKSVLTRRGLELQYIQTAINGGVWAAGQTFTAFNQYMVFSGTAYKPISSTPLPHVIGATPDLSKVEPVDTGATIVDAAIDRLNPATMADWQNDTTAKNNDVINLKEFATDNGGGSFWDVFPASTFPTGATIFNVLNHGSLTLQAKYRDIGPVDPVKLGADIKNNVSVSALLQSIVDSADLGAIANSKGQFKVDTAVALPNGTTIKGEGRFDNQNNTTQFIVDGNTAFTLVSDAANITLENFSINGKDTVGSKGITAPNSNFFSIVIREVNFFNFGSNPIDFNNVDQLRMDSCWFNQNVAPVKFGVSDGLVTNTLFEGKLSDLSNSPVSLIEVGDSSTDGGDGGLKFLDIQLERSKIGIRSNARLDVNGINYSNVRCVIYLEGGTAVVNDLRPVPQGNEVLAFLVGDCTSYQFTRVPLNANGNFTRNIKPKFLANLNAERFPSVWSRVDDFTPVNFITANNASHFETDDYIWLQNGGSFAPEGSSAPKIDLGTLNGSYVFELINNGTGFFHVGTAGVDINSTQSDGFRVDRKCTNLTSANYEAFPGGSALGVSYAEFNVYLNLFISGSFDDDLNDALTVLSGTPTFSTDQIRGGFGKSLKITTGVAYLTIPQAAKTLTIEEGVYIYIPSGVTLTVSTFSDFFNFDDKDILDVDGDDKWHLFRTPIMPGTQAFNVTLKFKFDGTVYFDDAACIEMTT